MKNINTAARGLVIFLAIIFSAASVQAYTVSFADGYQGGKTPNKSNGSSWDDVVGDTSVFNVSQLTYTSNGAQKIIGIQSNYFSVSSGRSTTQLGDLFISTDGWNIDGSAPYASDTMANGGWELAAVLNSHDPTNKSGTITLYNINQGSIVPSFYGDNDPNHFRSQQEVQFLPRTNESGITGDWAIIGDILQITFNYDFVDGQKLAFHWSMTCANDVIEGEVTNRVPEPGTMLLLGFGLVSLVGMGRLRRK